MAEQNMATMPSKLRRVKASQSTNIQSALATLGMYSLIAFMVLAPMLTFNKPEPFTGDGNPMRQIFYILIFATVFLASVKKNDVWSILPIPLGLALLLAWCWISLLWSDVADIGVRRLILTTLVVWSVFLSMQTVGYDRVVGAIRIIFPLATLANYMAVILMPSIGIQQAQEIGDPGIVGSWSGIMMQKNMAGSVSAFTILFFTLDARKTKPWLRIVIIVAAAYFLYRSNSKTSIGILLFALLMGALYTKYNPKYRPAVIAGVLLSLAGIGFLAIFNIEAINTYLSNPASFTGRVEIWNTLLAYSHDHPLGSGYGSFWNVGKGSPIYEYSTNWVAHMAIGHSGYIDMLAATGWPGLLLLVAFIAILPIAQLVGSTKANRSHGALLLATILFCVGHNFTETSFYDRDAIVNVFALIAIALIRIETGPQSPAKRKSILNRIPKVKPLKSLLRRPINTLR